MNCFCGRRWPLVLYLRSLVVESSYALNSMHGSAWDIKTFVEASGDMHNSHRLHYHFFP